MTAATLSVPKQWDYLLCGEKDCKDPIHEEGRCVKHYALWRAHWRDICPGRCNDNWRAADTGYRQAMDEYAAAMEAWTAAADAGLPEPPKPEPPDFTPWGGDPVFCGRCSASVRSKLLDIRDLAADIDAENLGLRRGPETERVSGSRHPSSPSPVGNDLEDLSGLLRDWESKAHGQDPLPRRGHLAPEIRVLCNVLATQSFPRLMAIPETAVDFADDVRAWYTRLRSATRTGTGRHQKNRPCPRCDRYSLVWEEGNEHVECQTPSCGRLMSLTEYEQYDSLFPHFEDTAKSA